MHFWHRAWQCFKNTGHDRHQIVFGGHGQGRGALGQPERLVRLFGAVATLYTRLGGSPWSANKVAMSTSCWQRAQLGEDAYVVAWAAGQSLTLEQAIAEALEIGAIATSSVAAPCRATHR
jgi:hypothetical protein